MSKEKRILTDEEKSKIAVAKEELNEYRENIGYIEEKQNDLEEIKTILEKVTTRLSKTKTSNNSMNTDKFSDGINRAELLQKDCDKALLELMLKKFVIDNKIEQVGNINKKCRNVLFYRYARDMDWGSIARKMNYSEDWIHDLHRDALYFYSKI